MTKQEMLEAARTVCRVRRLSRHTEESYVGWLARFADHAQKHRQETREERIRLPEELARLYVESKARHWAADIVSPLDVVPVNVVPFPTCGAPPANSATPQARRA